MVYAEVVKIYGKNKTSIHEIMKNGKEIRVSFEVIPQNEIVTATVHDKCSVKAEKGYS